MAMRIGTVYYKEFSYNFKLKYCNLLWAWVFAFEKGSESTFLGSNVIEPAGAPHEAYEGLRSAGSAPRLCESVIAFSVSLDLIQ